MRSFRVDSRLSPSASWTAFWIALLGPTTTTRFFALVSAAAIKSIGARSPWPYRSAKRQEAQPKISESDLEFIAAGIFLRLNAFITISTH